MPSLQPAEQEPLANRLAPRQPLPDDLERAAGRLAALALADQPDRAAEVLGWMNDYEERRMREGRRPSGLLDNGLDLLNALDGTERYPARAEELLRRKDLDPVTRRRIEHALESQPLRVASRRLHEDRVRKLGSLFNRLVAPASHLLLGGGLPALETSQAALASILLMRSFPEATTQERQALRAYQEFLVRHPHAPESEWVGQKVERYERELRHQLLGQALEVAEEALKQGHPMRR